MYGVPSGKDFPVRYMYSLTKVCFCLHFVPYTKNSGRYVQLVLTTVDAACGHSRRSNLTYVTQSLCTQSALEPCITICKRRAASALHIYTGFRALVHTYSSYYPVVHHFDIHINLSLFEVVDVFP